MWCRPHDIDKSLTASLACEPPKIVCTDDHDFIAAVDRHVLRSFFFCASDHFAELGLGLLQLPPARPPGP
jgi:hypothetical protein